jgi:DNA primase
MTSPRPKSEAWLDAEALKAISVRELLDRYGLLESLTERGSTLSGPSPFTDGSVLSINLEKNVWNDSSGRPELEGRPVPGNVIGLMQALESVSFRRALEILSERFMKEGEEAGEQTRAKASAALRQKSVEAKVEGNTPFGKELQGLKADVPFLRSAGISPELAKAWGVGWCSRGLLRGRIAFPIRSPDGTVMGYVGLSTKADDPELWKFPSGFQRSLELFGIDRIHWDETSRAQAREFGLTLTENPLEVLRMQTEGRPKAVVSPMGAELSEAQLTMLLDPAINPTARLTLAGQASRRAWANALIRLAWVRFAEPSDQEDNS